MPFVLDTFTDAFQTRLQAHDPDTGDVASWDLMGFEAQGTDNNFEEIEINNNRAGTLFPRRGTPNPSRAYRNNTDPTDNEYDVKMDINLQSSSIELDFYTLLGRMSSTGNTSATVDRYLGYYRNHATPASRIYELAKVTAGTFVSLDTLLEDAGSGTKELKLEIRDAAKKVFLDSVEKLTSADNGITQNGRVGLGTPEPDNFQSVWIDNFDATLAAPGATIVTGTATLAGAGAIAGLGELILVGAGALSGAGAIAGVGNGIVLGAGALSGAGVIAGTGIILFIGTSTLSGSGALTSIGRIVAVGASTLAGAGDLNAAGVVVPAAGITLGTASLSGSGDLAGGDGTLIALSAGALTGAGAIVGTGLLLFIGASTLSGAGSILGVGHALVFGTSALTGAGAIVGSGAVVGDFLPFGNIEHIIRGRSGKEYRLIMFMQAIAAGTVEAHLFDVTLGVPVANSLISTTSLTPVRIESPALTIVSGNTYRIETKG